VFHKHTDTLSVVKEPDFPLVQPHPAQANQWDQYDTLAIENGHL